MTEVYTQAVPEDGGGPESRIREAVVGILERAERDLGAPVDPRSVSVWWDGVQLMATVVVTVLEQRFQPLGGG